MRARSWERLGLDGLRVLGFTAGCGSALFAIVTAAGLEVGLGGGALALGALAAAMACYLLLTAPRREVSLAAFRQTAEAPSLASSANIYLRSTSSRSKALLLLRADEPRLRAFLADARRFILLGHDAAAAVEGADLDGRVFSESVTTIVRSAVGLDGSRVEEGSEELDGMLASSGLEDETKLPIMIAVAFFLPIMLVLFAAVTKGGAVPFFAALLAVEVVLLDIALAFSKTSERWSR